MAAGRIDVKKKIRQRPSKSKAKVSSKIPVELSWLGSPEFSARLRAALEWKATTVDPETGEAVHVRSGDLDAQYQTALGFLHLTPEQFYDLTPREQCAASR